MVAPLQVYPSSGPRALFKPPGMQSLLTSGRCLPGAHSLVTKPDTKRRRRARSKVPGKDALATLGRTLSSSEQAGWEGCQEESSRGWTRGEGRDRGVIRWAGPPRGCLSRDGLPRTCAAGSPVRVSARVRSGCHAPELHQGCRSPSGPSLPAPLRLAGRGARPHRGQDPAAAPAAGPAPGPPPLRLRRGCRHAPTSAGRAARPAPRCPAEACAGCTPAAESAQESCP